jgi:hypothetical protein
VSPVKYEMGFYILEEDILQSHRRESLKSYRIPSRLRFGSNALILYSQRFAFFDLTSKFTHFMYGLFPYVSFSLMITVPYALYREIYR